jgi:hypothetical protein
VLKRLVLHLKYTRFFKYRIYTLFMFKGEYVKDKKVKELYLLCNSYCCADW